MSALARTWMLVARLRRRASRGSGALPPYREVFLPLVRGRSFADVGAMWSVHGRVSFEAEEGGASAVTAVDGMEPTAEFEAEHRRRSSKVRFVHGDINDPATVQAVGTHDVVWSSGVVYHVPSPLLTIERLCSLTRETLVVQSRTIPEVPGMRQACVLFPGLSDRDRAPYARVFPGAEGVSTPFDPARWYANWWWGITPTALRAMVDCQPGLEVTRTITRPFDALVVASRVARP